MDGKAVENIVFERFGGGGDDDVGRASFPGFAQEVVESGEFNRAVRGEDGDMLAGGAKNFVDEVSDGGFAGSASDTNELHVADRVAIVVRQEFGAGALEFGLNGRFLFRFGFRGSHSVFHHGVIVSQKRLSEEGLFAISRFRGLFNPIRYGMPDTSRTCDLQLRKLTLYPSELRAHVDILQR